MKTFLLHNQKPHTQFIRLHTYHFVKVLHVMPLKRIRALSWRILVSSTERDKNQEK